VSLGLWGIDIFTAAALWELMRTQLDTMTIHVSTSSANAIFP